MKRIIIFRFHDYLEICRNNLEIISELNPGISIYGVYGGEEEKYNEASKSLGDFFEDIYNIAKKDSHWKWQNFDLVLREWYSEFGKSIDFDMAYVIEWDMLLCDSIAKIYKDINKGELGVTALNKLSNIEDKWDWTSKEPYKTEWKSILEFVKSKYNYNSEPYGSLAGGLCVPKDFLEEYSKAEVPELCHDELRVPLYAQVLGFNMKDTGFYRKWFDDEEKKVFNAADILIDQQVIKAELSKNDGRRVFHPVREIFDKNLIRSKSI